MITTYSFNENNTERAELVVYLDRHERFCCQINLAKRVEDVSSYTWVTTKRHEFVLDSGRRDAVLNEYMPKLLPMVEDLALVVRVNFMQLMKEAKQWCRIVSRQI